jgi:hypothetical protein
MRLWPLLLILVFLSSGCATLFNHAKTKVLLEPFDASDSIAVRLRPGDPAVLLPAMFRLSRSSKNAEIWVSSRHDSLIRSAEITSRLSAAFWVGNILWIPYSYLFDLAFANERIYGYGRRNTLSWTENGIKVKRGRPWYDRSGTVNMVLGFPFVNKFTVRDKGWFGFGGVSMGLEYYRTNRRYWSLQFGTATNETAFRVDAPSFLNDPGFNEFVISRYASLRLNQFLSRRWEIGAGLQYSHNIYRKRYYSPGFQPKEEVAYPGLGLSAALSCRLGRGVGLGLLYQPNFIRWGGGEGRKYERLLSLELDLKYNILVKK